MKKAKTILSEVSNFKVSNNCQKFAVALELKFRGIDREPTPTTTPVAKVFDVPVGKKSPFANWCMSKSARFVKIAENDPIGDIIKTMKGWGAHARAIIAVTWEWGRGHVFNLAVLDGEVYMLDGTTNKCTLLEKASYLRNNIDAKKSRGLLRSDNLSVDANMIDDTFSPDVKEFGLNTPTNKYISVTAALSKEGEKGKTYVVYRNKKKIGTVVCTSIAETYGKYFTVWNYSWR